MAGCRATPDLWHRSGEPACLPPPQKPGKESVGRAADDGICVVAVTLSHLHRGAVLINAPSLAGIRGLQEPASPSSHGGASPASGYPSNHRCKCALREAPRPVRRFIAETEVDMMDLNLPPPGPHSSPRWSRSRQRQRRSAQASSGILDQVATSACWACSRSLIASRAVLPRPRRISSSRCLAPPAYCGMSSPRIAPSAMRRLASSFRARWAASSARDQPGRLEGARIRWSVQRSSVSRSAAYATSTPLSSTVSLRIEG